MILHLFSMLHLLPAQKQAADPVAVTDTASNNCAFKQPAARRRRVLPSITLEIIMSDLQALQWRRLEAELGAANAQLDEYQEQVS